MYERLSRASRQLGWRRWWWEWRILEISDTEQGDFALETQQDSDSSDEDIADTQAAGERQKGKGKGKGKSKSICRGNMYWKRRLTKEARKLLFCSVLRRSRN